jgi:hypothetical protein
MLAAASVIASLFTSPARADYTFYRTGPHTGACWNKVTAYGGVYQITNNLLNTTVVGSQPELMRCVCGSGTSWQWLDDGVARSSNEG